MQSDSDDGSDDHWLSDPRFKDDISRGDHAEIISERTQRWCDKRTTDEALQLLDVARIPAASVLSPQQTLDNTHVQESGMLSSTGYPGLAKDAPIVSSPFRLTATPGTVRHRAPQLGEHTDEVLEALGYGEQQIAALRANRVV